MTQNTKKDIERKNTQRELRYTDGLCYTNLVANYSILIPADKFLRMQHRNIPKKTIISTIAIINPTLF